jgi:hypothetical protein
MDPVSTVLGPWAQLGIVGSVVIALGYVVWLQWQHINKVTADHLADVKMFGTQYAAALTETSKTNSQLAAAIERIGDRIKA